MLPLVEFPELVKHYAPAFASVFSAEAWVEFERYISGLIVSENKTVDGINRLFVHESRNQSSLNRLLTQSPYDLTALNEARLQLLASLPGTQMKPKGVFSLDDTLLIHSGTHFAEIAPLWDHVSESYVLAHDLVTLHYSDEDTDYPTLFQLWKPVDLDSLEQGLRAAAIPLKDAKQALKTEAPHKWREYLLGVWRRRQKQHPELAALYDSKLHMGEHLLQAWGAAHPDLKLPVAFDSWFTQPGFCQYLDQTLTWPYVGALAADERVILKRGTEPVAQFADELKQEHLTALERTGTAQVFHPIRIHFKGQLEYYYSYCETHRLKNFGRLRLVINHREADLSDSPVCLVANRLHWQAPGITRIYRHRWPVEVYHEEGKAEGLDQYQLRDFTAVERHVALVAVVYSLLRAAQHDPILHAKLQRQLKLQLDVNERRSAGFWQRVTQAQSLWGLAVFIAAGLSQGQSLHAVMTPLLRAICGL
jgi:hypothetical protein